MKQPGKWLVSKKLETAHFLLMQKRMKPSEVYLEVGFNDYSHFFLSFKKIFGIAPSMLNQSRKKPVYSIPDTIE